jgi:hypothetical protein
MGDLLAFTHSSRVILLRNSSLLEQHINLPVVVTGCAVVRWTFEKPLGHIPGGTKRDPLRQ